LHFLYLIIVFIFNAQSSTTPPGSTIVFLVVVVALTVIIFIILVRLALQALLQASLPVITVPIRSGRLVPALWGSWLGDHLVHLFSGKHFRLRVVKVICLELGCGTLS
jgi:hypothetical protein